MDSENGKNQKADTDLAQARRRAHRRDRAASGTLDGHVTYRGVDIGSRDSLLIDILPVKSLLDALDPFTLRGLAGVLVDGDGQSYMILAAKGRFNPTLTGAVERAVRAEHENGGFPDFDNVTILSDDGTERSDFS